MMKLLSHQRLRGSSSNGWVRNHPLDAACRMVRVLRGRQQALRYGHLVLLSCLACNPLPGTWETVGAQGSIGKIVAARVGDQPVRQAMLEYEWKQVQQTREITPAVQPTLQAQLLARRVDQLLILRYLEDSEQAARASEIDLALGNLESRIQQEDNTLKGYLQLRGLNNVELRQNIAWQIGWSRYLNRYLSDENYAQYFKQHRRDFDGTQLRVSHLLLKLSPSAGAAEVTRRRDTLKQIYQQIVSGVLDFPAAARQFSESPTAAEGGDLGWIERYEPMPDSFSAAAFQLQQGRISGPVRTSFGFHLIYCQAVKPGERTWNQVREPLRQAITRYLFRWTADQQRKRLRVDFTGTWPYFDPQTGALVSPGKQSDIVPGLKR